MTSADVALADAWRTSWSRLVGLLIGQYQRPDLAEDAVGDAFESAARHWPDDGVPTNPGAWLLTAARRRVLDRLRTESVHRRKEPLMAVDDEMRAVAAAATSLDDDGAHIADEQLRLVFACCHPALAADDRVALTLRFVVGLTTAEIARLLLVQETAMAARLTRAKKRLASSGIPFAVPPPDQLATRLDVVATVFYLMFTSGYQPGSGPVTLRVDLADEAIRLVRQLRTLLPSASVLSSLLALLLLQHSRRDARLSPSGDLVLLPEQDRALWHTDEIEEALSLLPDQAAATPSPATTSSPVDARQPRAGVPAPGPHRGGARDGVVVGRDPVDADLHALRRARGADGLPGRPPGAGGCRRGGLRPRRWPRAARGPRRRAAPPPPPPGGPRGAPGTRRRPPRRRDRVRARAHPGHQRRRTHPPHHPPSLPPPLTQPSALPPHPAAPRPASRSRHLIPTASASRQVAGST